MQGEGLGLWTLAVCGMAVIGWVTGWLLFWRLLRPARPVGPLHPGTLRRLSIVVPARDEERGIAKLLRSLDGAGLSRWGSAAEVIVVDDNSRDRTRERAQECGVRVIDAGERPAGWIGKSWACWRGARAAKGELLLFLDADTFFEPDGLLALAALHEASGGLLSVQPYHRMERPVERLSALFNAVVMAATGGFEAFTPWGAADGGFGPCMLLERTDYFRSGGHRRVRRSLIEDMALARFCAARGIRVNLRAGRGVIAFRMYPGGLGAIVEGWAKNLAPGASTARRGTLLRTSIWLVGALAGFVALSAWFLRPIDAPPWLGAGSTAVYFALCLQIGVITSRIGNFGPLSALVYPVNLLFFFAVYLRSIYLHLVRREVRWKGRRIRISGGHG